MDGIANAWKFQELDPLARLCQEGRDRIASPFLRDDDGILFGVFELAGDMNLETRDPWVYPTTDKESFS
jgi:hypothetical protein